MHQRKNEIVDKTKEQHIQIETKIKYTNIKREEIGIKRTEEFSEKERKKQERLEHFE